MITARFIGGPWHNQIRVVQDCREHMVPFRTLSSYGPIKPMAAISTARYIRAGKVFIMDTLWQQWEAAYHAAGPQLARS